MTVESKEWDMEKLDEGVVKIVGELQLRKYGKFMEDYSTQLQDIEHALDETINDSWDMSLDPISLQFLPYEQTTVLDLVSTDNKILNKVISVLAALCCEMNTLCHEASTKFYNPILLYGEGIEVPEEGQGQIWIGRMIPFLQELSCYVTRCYTVTKNVVHQLGALYSNVRNESSVIDVTDVHFQTVFEHLGDMLATLITLDELIDSQATFREHFQLYKRMIKSVYHDPTRFNTSVEKLRSFEMLLNKLEVQLLDGRIFVGCCEQGFDDGRSLISKNALLSEEFMLNLRNMFLQIDAKLGDSNELDARSHLVGICGILVLHFYLFRDVDRKFFRQLWDTYKKIPAIPLAGNVLWFLDQFILEKLPHMAQTMDRKAHDVVRTQRQNFLQQRSQTLPKDSQVMYLQVVAWMVKMDSEMSSTGKLMSDLNRKFSLLLHGLMLGWYISHQVKTIMNLHAMLDKPMTKASVVALCKMIEMLKAIDATFHRQSVQIAKSITHIVQHFTNVALSAISIAKKRLVSDRKYSERKLDVLSALVLGIKALNGPGTKERRLIAHLTMAIGTYMKTFKDDELNSFNSAMRKLDLVCDMRHKLKAACDCSGFYWHRGLLSTYFGDLYDNTVGIHRIHYMFAAIRDCVYPLLNTRHEASPQLLLDALHEEVYNSLKDRILDPLCKDIETDLRLQSHSHLQLDDRNPFRVGLKDLTHVLALYPIRLFDRVINVKAYVEHYLSKIFYNLTTVALHDWKTYGEMRSIAKQKYGLITVESHLPNQTLEQGLDVLEIMRNIHVFVSKYLYNLNNQIFVERSSSNKHLNTINIRHIANSIRTHGIGIMNTTVNFTYQFLRKKFYIFSQFLYDEHIKSKLIRDLRYFREHKAQHDQKYPYDKADKFNRGIRKLGLTPDGQSYLDQFRVLVSQIGNAMGFVRMIRSGGLHCCSNAIRFIPDLDDIVNFEDMCREENLSTECIEAAAKLDEVINNLTKNFSEGTEYFKLLVDVFSPAFRDPKNIHLRNFFVIVPPLTVNYVEHSILCKERMSRKNKVGAAFTDDGFAMGVAYILKLLDQYQDFDSLHWFHSVRDKYRKDKEEVKKQNSVAMGKDDEKLQQAMTLTVKRLDVYQREFDLLSYSLRSARIFFRADLTADEEKEEKKSQDEKKTDATDQVKVSEES